MINLSLKMLGEKDLMSYSWLSYGGQPESLIQRGLKFTKCLFLAVLGSSERSFECLLTKKQALNFYF